MESVFLDKTAEASWRAHKVPDVWKNDKDDEDHKEEEVEKVEKSAAPRLSKELLEAKEQKVPEDSLDGIYWTPSVQSDLSDCHQPYSSASSSLKNQLTCPALDVACEYSSLKATELHGPPGSLCMLRFCNLFH
ncbi:hypothetical protein P7K49_016507 [Saguinus oedipus]|uniref:Olduvai domain-containing protein n=1 Tax=Saguinus oedipus TaxID=9490 RepID=A0ABQ9VCA3_SAGOE|nr:hypothetical protein P7K49_016507 [Saguinus oedipus]